MKGISLNKIPQKSIRSFIQEQINNNVNCIQDLKSTYKRGDDLTGYLQHEEVYHIAKNQEDVWHHYLKANPNTVWNGKMVSFGLLVSKHDDEVMYVDEEYSEVKVGQIFYINLNILKGFLKIAVSHEIIAVNPDENYIEISYVEGSKSFGKQRISIEKTTHGNTKVVHTTYYKSKSNFRDRYLYPFFHSKVLTEYHNNMKREIIAS